MRKNLQLVIGKNPVCEVLKSSPSRFVHVYTSHTEGALLAELKEERIPCTLVHKNELTQMAGSDSHQGFVAEIQTKWQPSLQEFLDEAVDKSHSLVLLLDSICDPHNVGAMIRSAECFGADLVIYSQNRGAPITPVVTKTSAGATELVPIAKVANLVETVKKLQKNGFWVVAAEATERSQSLYDFSFPEKTVLILGSEGDGVQKLLSTIADYHVQIPMLGKLDSLNVSQATAIFMAFYRRAFVSNNLK